MLIRDRQISYLNHSTCVLYEYGSTVWTEKLISSVNYQLDKNPVLRDSKSSSSPAFVFEYFLYHQLLVTCVTSKSKAELLLFVKISLVAEPVIYQQI